MDGEIPPPPLTPSASRILPPPAQPAAPPSLRSPSPTTAKICGEHPAAGEVLGDHQPHASGEVGEKSSEDCGELQRSSDVRGVRKVTSDSRVEQRDGNEVTMSLPFSKKSAKKVTIAHSNKICPSAGTKRPLSEASGSTRARKAAKMIDAKCKTSLRLREEKLLQSCLGLL